MRLQTTVVTLSWLPALFVGIVCTCRMYAVPVVPPDLTSLIAGSDEVLVGDVTEIHEVRVSTIMVNGDSVPVKLMDARISVQQAIMGESVPEAHVSFLVPLRPVGYHAIPPASHRIFFLKKLSNGVAEPASPYYPSLPAGSPRLAATEQVTVLEKVLMFIGAVFSPPVSSLSEREEALWVLHFVNSPIVTRALRDAASQDSDPGVKLNAVAELLRRNELSVLPLAEQVLMNPASSGISIAWRLDEIEQNLSSAVGSVKDERAIPSLNEILKSPDVRGPKRGRLRSKKH